MSGLNEVARTLFKQGPSRVESHAVAADNQTISQRKSARHNGGTVYTVTTTDGDALTILLFERLKQQCVQWHDVDVSTLEFCSELHCIAFLNDSQVSKLLDQNLSCASVFSTFDHAGRDMSDRTTSHQAAFYASDWLADSVRGCTA